MSDERTNVGLAAAWIEEASRPDLRSPLTSDFAAIAQAHATLALVEQQRIANMIALAEVSRPLMSSDDRIMLLVRARRALEGDRYASKS